MAYKIGETCIACGICLPECPTDAITEGSPYVVDQEKCVDCGACTAVCPVGAPQPE